MRPALLVGLVALALASEGASPSMAQEGRHGLPPSSSSTPRVPPAPPDSDLLEIRNIFRYADEVGARLDSPRGPRDGGADTAIAWLGNRSARQEAGPGRPQCAESAGRARAKALTY